MVSLAEVQALTELSQPILLDSGEAQQCHFLRTLGRDTSVVSDPSAEFRWSRQRRDYHDA
jgi:hypothetical protein